MITGKSLQALRKRRGLTQKSLGDLCGVARDDIARYERGEVRPRRENVRKIEEALGEPVAFIQDGLCWSEAEPPEDWEAQSGRALLYRGILQTLEEAYGGLRAGTFKDSQGRTRPFYTVGVPPDSFVLYESDLAKLAEAVLSVAAPLIEHMKDVRPERAVIQEIFAGFDGGFPPTGEREYALTDEQWEAVRDLLPSEKAGRGRAFKDNRLMLEGILYWMRTGVAWKKLPERYGRYRCVYDRLRLWNDMGVWPGVLAKMLELGIIEEGSIVVDSVRFRERK